MTRRQRSCPRAKAAFIRAEVRAHLELAEHGKTRAYKAAEHASEAAFAEARKLGCTWAKRRRRR